MQCQTVKLVTIPASEPFTGFQTVLFNTDLKLQVEYFGAVISTEGSTDDTGKFPIILGFFPPGMVNEYDRFTLTFTDAENNPIAVDGEGNSVFIIQPE